MLDNDLIQILLQILGYEKSNLDLKNHSLFIIENSCQTGMKIINSVHDSSPSSIIPV